MNPLLWPSLSAMARTAAILVFVLPWETRAQLQDAGTIVTAFAPKALPAGLTNIVAVSAGSNILALRADSTVAAWQWDWPTMPWVPPNGVANVAAVAAGYRHNVLLMRDGTVQQWPATAIPPVPADATNIMAIAAGWEFTVALRSNGTVVAWGRSGSPTNVPANLTNVIAIAAGRRHVLALTQPGNVIAWGDNTSGQLNVPPAATNIALIAAVGARSATATANGVLWAWGQGYTVPARIDAARELKQIAATANSMWLLDRQGNLLRFAVALGPWGVTNLLSISGSESNLYMIARGPVLRSDVDPPTVQSGGFGANWALLATVESYHPFSYQWFFNGAILSGATNPLLRLVGLRSTEAGPYFVMVSNRYGTMTSAPVMLNVSSSCDGLLAWGRRGSNAFAGDPGLESFEVAVPSAVPGVDVRVAAQGVYPATSMAFAPDGRIFFCHQDGSLRITKNGRLFSTLFVTVTTYSGAEAGVLGVALDPGFQTNGFVYVYYTVPYPDRHNRISRFTAEGDVARPCSEKVLFEIEHSYNILLHEGGAIHFGPDGKLYAAVGDHTISSEAPLLNSFAGKILRLNSDGGIPEDNPFYSVASGTYRAIWAAGLRNPFTFAIHEQTGRMLINNVGTRWEELNEGFAGANYGWPYEEGFSEANVYVNPVYSYGTGVDGCAIIGAAFYDPPHRLLPAEYMGSYFFGDYCNGWIRRLDTNGVVHEFASNIPRLVDIDVGPDGALYCLTLEGTIYRFSAASKFLSSRYVPGNRIHLHASGVPNQIYILEASGDFQTWQPVATNQSATVEFDFDLDAGLPQRFYRLRD